MKPSTTIKLALAGVTCLALLIITPFLMETIPAGRVAVATSFGEVQPEPYTEGLHFPVLPWYDFTHYDTRQQTLAITKIKVPSQDRLSTTFDLNVQYTILGGSTPALLQEVGTQQQVVDVHLTPATRSLLRDAGKTVLQAEDFFKEGMQSQLQDTLQAGLQEYMDAAGVGIQIQAVLLRNMQLPTIVHAAIEQTKKREQEAEMQSAELQRFRIEQEQKVAQAEAEKNASAQQAEQIMLLADAQAYEIKAINDAIASNPAYIQLQSLEALKAISRDPAAKIYFMDGSSPQPLPLMHLGEMLK